MADYKYIKELDGSNSTKIIKCTIDNSFIPNDSQNKDWVVYQEWLAESNTPDNAE